MTNPQTEARAIALEPLNDLARKKDLFIDNAATASQTDFDEVTREAIELNVIAPLILALSERDTALAAKDAELVEKNRLLEIALRETAPARDAAIARAERAEAQLAEANRKIAERDKALANYDRWLNGRDAYIVQKGLWQNFVASLPGSPTARRALEGGKVDG